MKSLDSHIIAYALGAISGLIITLFFMLK